MSGDPLRVLVLDRSLEVGQALRHFLERKRGWSVTVADAPALALAHVRRGGLDVVLADLRTPGLDATPFLRQVREAGSVAVVSFADGATSRGSGGAGSQNVVVDAVERPSDLRVAEFLDEYGAALLGVLQRAATRRVAAPLQRDGHHVGRRAPSVPTTVAEERIPEAVAEGAVEDEPGVAAPPHRLPRERSVVVIGTSMGGPEALREVLSTFPLDAPPCVVVQHMMEEYTAGFADRLDASVTVEVKEATCGDVLLPGQVLLAPGGRHLVLCRRGRRLEVRIDDGPRVQGHRPSVEVLFRSAAAVLGPAAVGVLLTGIGEDGAEGLLEMRRAGAATVAQDEATCVAFGMPGAAIRRGAVEKVVPIGRVGPLVLRLCGRDAVLPGERREGTSGVTVR